LQHLTASHRQWHEVEMRRIGSLPTMGADHGEPCGEPASIDTVPPRATWNDRTMSLTCCIAISGDDQPWSGFRSHRGVRGSNPLSSTSFAGQRLTVCLGQFSPHPATSHEPNGPRWNSASRPRHPFGMMGVVGVRCPVLVGRDAELGVLQASLAAALGGRGGFAAICGDAGLGKSRLCRELIKGSPLGMLATVRRARPSDASMPYRPLAEAVLGLLRPRSEWIDEPQLMPWLPVLAQMVPVPGVLPAGQTSSAARGEAMLRLLGWLGAEHGLLMVLEDLHWA